MGGMEATIRYNCSHFPLHYREQYAIHGRMALHVYGMLSLSC